MSWWCQLILVCRNSSRKWFATARNFRLWTQMSAVKDLILKQSSFFLWKKCVFSQYMCMFLSSHIQGTSAPHYATVKPHIDVNLGVALWDFVKNCLFGVLTHNWYLSLHTFATKWGSYPYCICFRKGWLVSNYILGNVPHVDHFNLLCRSNIRYMVFLVMSPYCFHFG